MGIIRTDDWMNESFYNVQFIEEKILDTVQSREQFLINSLYKNGLYRPNLKTKSTFNQMKEGKLWEKLNIYYKKYKRLWKGPDVPVFLFPIGTESFRIFRKENKKKSGIAFLDKLFLFVSGDTSDRELEALFVHEYHHTARLAKISENMSYTLGNTIVMEGLAEMAVEEYCGRGYLAPWIAERNPEDLQKLLKDKFDSKFNVKRSEKLHDQLLFGYRSIPKMAGYAVGYKLVKDYANDNDCKTIDLIDLSADEILKQHISKDKKS